MKRLIATACLSALLLAGCGKSEDQIRAEERARMLEQQLAEERARNAAPAPIASASQAPAAPVAAPPAPAAPPPSSTVNASPRARLIGSYQAYIDTADLYNSNGQRITQPWAVLRQDRANFHRFGISQMGDTGDDFFASERNRAIMENMVRSGSMTAEARQLIVQGGAVVKVDIYAYGDTGEYLDITVF